MSKIRRTLNILFDRSEAFQDRPSYRYEIILNIWRTR
jgi:hypothetical protein